MREADAVAAPAPPAHAQLIQMFAGSWVSVALYAAAKLGIADHLTGGARSAVELALLWARTRRHCTASCARSRDLAS